MKRLIWVLALITFLAAGNCQAIDKQPQVFVIHRPTIVAFFPPVARPGLDSDPDTNEALSDFQFYSGQAKSPLHEVGIDFFEADATSFKIRVGAHFHVFRTGKGGVGYYFINPGKKAHIEYGVMTGKDLLDAAWSYFGIAIPPAR
jgi:hypothetical protein